MLVWLFATKHKTIKNKSMSKNRYMKISKMKWWDNYKWYWKWSSLFDMELYAGTKTRKIVVKKDRNLSTVTYAEVWSKADLEYKRAGF